MRRDWGMLATEDLRAAALEVADDGIVITDAREADHPIIYASPSFERLVGQPLPEMLGRNCRMFQGPGTDADTVSRIRAAVASGNIFAGEILNYRLGGVPFWNFLRIAPLRDADGRITHFVGTQTDVSERREALDRRRELEDAISHASRVRTVAALGASLAHEVNQPLAAIVANAEAALRLMDAGKPDDVREALEAIVADGRRAGEIIHRVRGLVRREPRQNLPIEPNALVKEVVRLAGVRIRHAGIEAVQALDAKVPLVAADPVQLHQALLNLVVNAIESMEDDGGGTLRVATAQDGAGVRFTVSDTGPGADDAAIERMFNTFYTTKARGTGLGLLVTRSIVEAHGGRLAVARNRGRGLVFRFTLPAAKT